MGRSEGKAWSEGEGEWKWMNPRCGIDTNACMGGERCTCA